MSKSNSGRLRFIPAAGTRFGKCDRPDIVASELSKAFCEQLGIDYKEPSFEEWEAEFVKKHVQELTSTKQPVGKLFKQLGIY